MPPVRRQISPRAARLRRDATDTERLLWSALRNRGLCGAKFRRQHTIDRYVVDFACLKVALVIELDGGQHSPEADAAYAAFIEGQGFRILRFWNNEVTDNLEGVLATIAGRVEKKTLTLPSPAKAGEG